MKIIIFSVVGVILASSLVMAKDILDCSVVGVGHRSVFGEKVGTSITMDITDASYRHLCQLPGPTPVSLPFFVDGTKTADSMTYYRDCSETPGIFVGQSPLFGTFVISYGWASWVDPQLKTYDVSGTITKKGLDGTYDDNFFTTFNCSLKP